MQLRRTVCAMTALALAVLLGACGYTKAGENNPEVDLPSGQASTSSTPPVQTTQPNNDPVGLPNKDPELFKAAAPCRLLTSDALHALFEGTFSNVLGTQESPVTDLTNTTRACNYTSSNARIDHVGNYDIASIAILFITELDDSAGTIWQGNVSAMPMTGGQSTKIPGADDAIRVGKGWYKVRKGQVIIEVSSVAENMTDEMAKKILAVALKKLP